MSRFNHSIKLVVISLVAILLAACETVPPYDYSALMASKPRSILVIPPMNDTVEVNAPYTFLATISKPLAEKGYYVFPVAVIDTFMKENGLPNPEEMNAVPLDKLREHIGPDAVLYTTINQWGQKYEVFQSRAVTNASLKLVDAQTGAVLWDATAQAVQQSGDGGAGLLGAVVNAIATQVMSNIVDQTPGLSSVGNNMAVNNTKRGLLPGPYAQDNTAR